MLYNNIILQEIWLNNIGHAVYKQTIDMSVVWSVFDHRRVNQ